MVNAIVHEESAAAVPAVPLRRAAQQQSAQSGRHALCAGPRVPELSLEPPRFEQSGWRALHAVAVKIRPLTQCRRPQCTTELGLRHDTEELVRGE